MPASRWTMRRGGRGGGGGRGRGGGGPAGRVGVLVGSWSRRRTGQGGENGVLLLGDLSRVGRVGPERGDRRCDAQRMGRADGRAQVVAGVEDAVRQGDGAGAQAVDARDVLVEGERGELGVVGLRREEEVPVVIARQDVASTGG